MRKLCRRTVVYLVATVLGIVMVFPFFWMFSTAFKSSNEVFSVPPRLMPDRFHFDNFREASNIVDIWRLLLNSTLYAVISVTLYLFIAPLAGYAIAKYDFFGRQVIFLGILATMMIPIEVLMVPLFKLLAKIGWVNTYRGLILPRLAEPFGVFLFRQHFVSIPNDYLDSARLDGCSEYGVFHHVALPLSKGPLVITGLFMFMWRWNELLWPLVIGNRSRFHTIQVGVATFIREYYVEWNNLFALCIMGVIPIAVLFILLQKYFFEGVSSMSGLKG